MTVAVLHPKGGVGRSTTVWQLGAELALCGCSVRIEDLDQAKHLSRIVHRRDLLLPGLAIADSGPADVVLLDTAPEADAARGIGYLRRADWVLVPVKGPEEASVQAISLVLDWLKSAPNCRLLASCPRWRPCAGPSRASGWPSCNAWRAVTVSRYSSRFPRAHRWRPGVWMATHSGLAEQILHAVRT